MTTASLPQAVLVFLLSLAACGLLYPLLRRRQVLDIPNDRSSHNRPTPKGGGIGFVAILCGVLIWTGAGQWPLVGLAVLTLAIALLGLADDLKDIAAAKRLVVQGVAALALVALVVATNLEVLVLAPLGLLFLLWCTNLYNFMDGIDGLAAVQGLLAGLLMAALDHGGVYPGSLAGTGTLVAAGCLAFLAFNFPPARMFMGDAGSGALGFLLGGIALVEFAASPDAFWLWLIALGGFVADATATLLVRLGRGKKPHQAHRSHLYQRLARQVEQRQLLAGNGREQARTAAHRRYLGIFALVFTAWQVPCAALVALGYLPGLVAAVICILPLLVGAVVLGAGRDA